MLPECNKPVTPEIIKPHPKIIIPMITPMKKDETGKFIIDEDASDFLINSLIEHGAGELFIFGYAGGCTKGLSVTQRKEHLEHVLKHVAGRVQVVVGIADKSLKNTIALAKHAEKAGADAAVLLLNQPNAPYEEQVAQVLENTKHISLILYNNPHIVEPKKNLTPKKLKKMIYEHPGRIIGLKESSGNKRLFKAFIALQKELDNKNIPFQLYMGDATKIPWIVANQTKFGFRLPGAVPVEANIPEIAWLYKLLIEGGQPYGIGYITIEKTILVLIDQGLVDKATLEFWKQS